MHGALTALFLRQSRQVFHVINSQLKIIIRQSTYLHSILNRRQDLRDSLLHPAMLKPLVLVDKLGRRIGPEKSMSGLSRIDKPAGMLVSSGKVGTARPLKVT